MHIKIMSQHKINFYHKTQILSLLWRTENAGVFHVLWSKTTVFYVTSSYAILCLHTSPTFCQHGKKYSTSVGKKRYKLAVCEVVGSLKR